MFRNAMLYPSNPHTFLDNVEKIMKSSCQKDKFYPPYNTYNRGEKTYIEVAVTGFRKDELKCYYDDEGLFVIEGSKEKEEVAEGEEKEYFVRHLSTKNFQRKFNRVIFSWLEITSAAVHRVSRHCRTAHAAHC